MLLLIIFLLSSKCYGQTTYDRKQDKRIDTLNWAIVKLLAISQQQDEKIKALEDSLASFKKRMVPFNTLIGVSPIKVSIDSLPNIFKIEYIKP